MRSDLKFNIAPTATLLLTLLLFPACGPSGEKAQEEPVEESREMITLRINAPRYLSQAPLFIARDEGFFTEQGLEVEFTSSHTNEAIPLLAKGDLDAAAALITISGLNSMARGAKMRIVADKGYFDPETCASDVIMARRSLVEGGGLSSPGQMKGLRISLDAASSEEYVVDTLLKGAGLSLDDLEVLKVPPPAELEALGEGSVDLVPISEPWVTRMSQAGSAVAWKPYQEVLPGFQFAVMIYGPSLLKDDPGAGRRLMTAYLKGVRQYNQGKTPRNLEIITGTLGLKPELLEDVCFPAIRGDGRIDIRSVVDFQAWAVARGYLDSPVSEDIFWDPSFIEHANDVLKQ